MYFHDRDTPDKQAIADAVMTAEIAAGQAVISTQVPQEFYWRLARKMTRRFDEAQAAEAVRDLTQLPVVQVDVPIIVAAVVP